MQQSGDGLAPRADRSAPARKSEPPAPLPTPLDHLLPEVEKRLVLEALTRAGGNKSEAAQLLGITRSQLYTRLRRFAT